MASDNQVRIQCSLASLSVEGNLGEKEEEHEAEVHSAAALMQNVKRRNELQHKRCIHCRPKNSSSDSIPGLTSCEQKMGEVKEYNFDIFRIPCRDENYSK
jgi:hypothetical protein